MKMICTHNQVNKNQKGVFALTIGKEYDVEEMNLPNTYEYHKQLPTVGGYVMVTNDKGRTQAYHKGYFKMA